MLIKPVSASGLLDTLMQAGKSDAAAARNAVPGRTAAFDDLRGVHGARLLIVEDNALNQQVASELLRDAGFWVDIADNGEIAIEMAREQAYDLVLMDMQMPVMGRPRGNARPAADARFC